MVGPLSISQMVLVEPCLPKATIGKNRQAEPFSLFLACVLSTRDFETAWKNGLGED